MNRTLKVLAAGALLLPVIAQAENGLSYSYVEAGFGQVDFDDLDADGDTLGLSGSLALTDNWHVFAGFSMGDLDGPARIDVDLDTWNVGVGYNHPISNTVDVIGRLSYIKQDFEVSAPGFGSVSGEDDGYGLGVGLRSIVMPNLELEGAVEYVDFGGNDGDDVSFGAAGRYFFTPVFAAGLNLGVSDDVKTYGVNFRLNFK